MAVPGLNCLDRPGMFLCKSTALIVSGLAICFDFTHLIRSLGKVSAVFRPKRESCQLWGGIETGVNGRMAKKTM